MAFGIDNYVVSTLATTRTKIALWSEGGGRGVNRNFSPGSEAPFYYWAHLPHVAKLIARLISDAPQRCLLPVALHSYGDRKADTLEKRREDDSKVCAALGCSGDMTHIDGIFGCIIAVKHKLRIAFVENPNEFKEISEGEAYFFNPKDVIRIAGGQYSVALPLMFASNITGVHNGGFRNLLTTYQESKLVRIRPSGKVEHYKDHNIKDRSYSKGLIECLRKMRYLQIEYSMVVQMFRGNGCHGVTWDMLDGLLDDKKNPVSCVSRLMEILFNGPSSLPYNMKETLRSGRYLRGLPRKSATTVPQKSASGNRQSVSQKVAAMVKKTIVHRKSAAHQADGNESDHSSSSSSSSSSSDCELSSDEENEGSENKEDRKETEDDDDDDLMETECFTLEDPPLAENCQPNQGKASPILMKIVLPTGCDFKPANPEARVSANHGGAPLIYEPVTPESTGTETQITGVSPNRQPGKRPLQNNKPPPAKKARRSEQTSPRYAIKTTSTHQIAEVGVTNDSATDTASATQVAEEGRDCQQGLPKSPATSVDVTDPTVNQIAEDCQQDPKSPATSVEVQIAEEGRDQHDPTSKDTADTVMKGNYNVPVAAGILQGRPRWWETLHLQELIFEQMEQEIAKLRRENCNLKREISQLKSDFTAEQEKQ